MSALRATFSPAPGRAIPLHVLAPITLGEPLDGVEQVHPNRLWTQIPAPHPSGDRVHQEQRYCRKNQQAGDVVDLLRPDFDEEEVEPPAGGSMSTAWSGAFGPRSQRTNGSR